jgi:Homeodomain-like domain
MALVVLSKVEQRLDAVRALLAGASVVEVAAAFGVSRISVHAWLRGSHRIYGAAYSRGLAGAWAGSAVGGDSHEVSLPVC